MTWLTPQIVSGGLAGGAVWCALNVAYLLALRRRSSAQDINRPTGADIAWPAAATALLVGMSVAVMLT